jgi:hypothetical protein
MNNNFNKITKMYDKLTYFDQYGGTFILFIVITIVVLILMSYFHTMINIQPIIDDWPNQRCNPKIIPFAGLITHPEGMSASEYTYQNFNYCTQGILSNITGFMVLPITYITNLLQSIVVVIQNALQSIRAMFDKVRNLFQSISEEIMGRIINITTPLIQIVISFKDFVGKIQGTMTAGLFTLLGSYYALQSLLGAVAQFIIIILIALAVLIVVFWIVPFTIPVAISTTVIFIAIAIPMAIILAFMMDTLHVRPDLGIPKLKCFDGNTLIKMNDGTYKKINAIEVGEILDNNNIVTAKIKVATEGSIMYNLNNVLVSDSHMVKSNDKWIKVCQHKDAVKCENYNEKFLYCLNTNHKIIEINNTIFTDWDEIYDESLNNVLNKSSIPNIDKESIHKYLDAGFAGHTKIRLKQNEICSLNKIKINDVLENGEKVYGIVEIQGSSLVKQYLYNLGEKKFVEGYSADFHYSKFEIFNKHSKLYHILTDKGTLKIENTIIQDYNAAIDRLLEK